MTKKKGTTTPTDILRAWWLANPYGTHKQAVDYARAHGFRRRDAAAMLKLSHQLKSLLHKSRDGNGGPSHLTIARRNKTRAANTLNKHRRSPREQDDMVILRTYWEKHMYSGSHEGAVKACIVAGVSTSVERSYAARGQAREDRKQTIKVRKVPAGGKLAEGEKVTLPPSEHIPPGGLVRRALAARTILDGAATAPTFEVPLLMMQAMQELLLGIDEATAALAGL